jgi:single-strand DNA-binding protein
MFDANIVHLGGRLGGEPAITSLPNGRRMVAFSIACETNWKDKNGKWHTDTDWHRVCSFLPSAVDHLARFGKLTGRVVYIQGELRNRKFEDNGETRYRVEVEVGLSGGIAVLPENRTAFSVNTVLLSGRLGADASITTRPGNKGKVASLSVGVDRSFKDRDGKWNDAAEWHRVVTTAPAHIDKVHAKDGTKGRIVQVQGRLRAREWTDKTTGEVITAHQIEADASGTILVIPEVRPKKPAASAAQ